MPGRDTHILQRHRTGRKDVETDAVERRLVCFLNDVFSAAQFLSSADTPCPRHLCGPTGAKIHHDTAVFVGCHRTMPRAQSHRHCASHVPVPRDALRTVSKWLVRQSREVHHVNTPIRLSTTAPDTEYASRNGALMLSMNFVYVAASRRVSSSSGNAVENLRSAANVRTLLTGRCHRGSTRGLRAQSPWAGRGQ